uniref:Uncharacterized protein n=1 Tax=Setaria italica TaxID=4555 RepID=A0A0Q3QGY6_SETIT
AVVASALTFSIDALRLRIGGAITLATATLTAFGCVGAVLGRTPVARSCARVVIGGWAIMGVTYSLMRLFKASGI